MILFLLSIGCLLQTVRESEGLLQFSDFLDRNCIEAYWIVQVFQFIHSKSKPWQFWGFWLYPLLHTVLRMC